MEKPTVKPGEWIYVGKVSAVVCTVFKEPRERHEIEVVYLDPGNQAVNEDAFWSGEGWEFASTTGMGGRADNYPRLSHYVSILRAGRYRSS